MCDLDTRQQLGQLSPSLCLSLIARSFMNPSISIALRAAVVAVAAWSSMASFAQTAEATATPLLLAYNPSNTNLIYNNPVGVKVSPDGQKLQVTTRPVSPYQGGLLNFGNYPWWITVADFSVGNKVGTARNGDMYRGTGALTPPAGQLYTIAKLMPGTTNVYQLTPVDMTGVIRGNQGSFTGTMHGTITTDGQRGRLTGTNIIDFDIVIEGTKTP